MHTAEILPRILSLIDILIVVGRTIVEWVPIPLVEEFGLIHQISLALCAREAGMLGAIGAGIVSEMGMRCAAGAEPYTM